MEHLLINTASEADSHSVFSQKVYRFPCIVAERMCRNSSRRGLRMADQTQAEPGQQAPQAPRWNIITRIAFRFFFLYLGLFVLCFFPVYVQLLFNPHPFSRLLLYGIWPMRPIVFWTGAHLFHVPHPLDLGAGTDGIYEWVEAFCLLNVAVLATGIWSVLDRRRENYITLHKWFHLTLRFVLAALMILYGMHKIIPAQMNFPNLFQLVQPFGHFSLTEVLWTSIGAAPAYEIFTGCMETLGGLLLIVPRTTALGALICLADLINVFALNLAYDVPVKLTVLHWILLTLVLLAPEVPRLAKFFFMNRTTEPSPQPQLFRTCRANRIALAVQIILGMCLLGASINEVWKTEWLVYGGGAPKLALYGIWDVDNLSMDGQERAPLQTDNDRWRRVIFDSGYLYDLNFLADQGAVVFQHMDDSLAYYLVSIDTHDKTITLTNPRDANWKARFTYERPAQDQLVIDGEMDQHKLHMQLELVDRKKFKLVSNGFHWIQ
jgi:uncharacterized membrane protein YphA (DoxX/SURF4 family)